MSIVHLLNCINSVKKTNKLNPNQILVLQKKRLKKLLKHVMQNSSFYRKYYKLNGINDGNIDFIELKDIPPIDKEIMMRNYNHFVCNPELKRHELERFISNPENRGKLYKHTYQVIHTSGSTGTIGIFVYGPNDWDILKAMAISRVTKSKINPFSKSKLAFIGATDGHYAGISLAQDAPRFLFKFMPFNINSSIYEIISKLNDYQPDALSGYSSGIYLLASEQLKGILNIHPKKIICSGDHLTPGMAKILLAAFNIKPTRFYASSESICSGAECEQGTFHLYNDWHGFEVVDGNFNPVPPNGHGRLLLTNLYNYTQPLIRYKMNDEIVLSNKSCQCGLPFPTIKSIAGRDEDFLWFEKTNGKLEFIHPIVFVEFHVPGLERFQIIQAHKNQLTFKAIVPGNKHEISLLIRERMREILSQKELVNLVNIDIEFVKEIKNQPKTGKFKLIIPYQAAISKKIN
ncbi:phenylacetate--CoA ligase family protein [bacterium]|nr:phenylacetate--CoA ligase family protein [bacterium]